MYLGCVVGDFEDLGSRWDDPGWYRAAVVPSHSGEAKFN